MAVTEAVTYQTEDLATPPDGTAIAADVIDNVAYQRVKISTGKDGEVDGDMLNTNPLFVSNWEGREVLQQILVVLKKIEYHLSIVSDTNLNDQDI